MPISLSVSSLYQSKAQSSRLTFLSNELNDLQRQVTTSKKNDTYTNFGTEAYNLQNIKTIAPKIESYMSNIDKAADDMEQMINLLTRISEIANEVNSAVSLKESDENGINALAEFAKANLDFIQELINEQGIDGNYLFAGSNLSTPPFVSNAAVNSNYKNEVANWLNGTITADQLQANSDAFSATNLGLSTALDTAYGRSIQIGDNLTVDYAVKANIDGIQDILRSMTLLANMEYPDGGDVGTLTEMDEILAYARTTLNNGITQTNDATQLLSSRFSFITSINETHQNDLNIYRSQIDETENVDPSEALLRMQLLKTQLETSYQITSIVSSLSLVNFMN